MKFVAILLLAPLLLGLANCGSSPHVHLSSNSAINGATRDGDLEQVRVLLKDNPDLIYGKEDDGQTLFFTTGSITMKFKSILVIALMISGVLLSFPCCLAETPQPTTDKTPLITKAISTKNDVQLEITVPALVRFGQSVEMIVTLKNRSSQAIVCPEIDEVHELGIQVLNDTKMTPEMTELGKARLKGNPYKYATFIVKPGQDHVWQVDLNSLFYLTPSKYRVSASIGLNRDQELPFLMSVSDVRFTISER